MLTKKLEERRQKIVAEILASGKSFAGAETIKQTPPGSKPKNTKTSTRHSYRPRVHSVCPIRRAEGKNFYFTNISSYRYASNKYRNGELDVEFPPGMYKPSCRPPPDGS